MVLYLGQNEVVSEERVIGVFDLDKCTASKRSKAFLDRAAAEGTVVDISGNLPRSFVVCDHPYHPQIVYLSQIRTETLKNRREPWETENGP